MSNNLTLVPSQSARRLFLNAQGLLEDPSRKATKSTLLKLIERLGFVQVDSINVVERAHHLTLSSRLDSYSQSQLNSLLENDRSLFEHWTHDASAIPTRWIAHWKPRFKRERNRLMSNKWWRERLGDGHESMLEHVRERIAIEGPLRSDDFEHDRQGESAAWWGWKPQKAALEFLWNTGELMVSRRESFQKVYDLTERVLPQFHEIAEPSPDQHVEWACSTAMERLQIATPREIAQFWDAVSIADADEWCKRAATAGRLEPVLVEQSNGAKPRPSFAVANWETRLKQLPHAPDRMRLLCPFDPVLRDRARALRLFGFDYRFEAFVPAPKRQYGYYVLPVLEGERFVARVDPRFDRAAETLIVQKVHWEPGERVTKARARQLEEAVSRLASFIGASSIEWASKNG
jgi:uncharacterized protein